MSKDYVSDWDTTPLSNSDVGGIDISSNGAVSQGDDAMRNIMAQIASYTRRGSDLASATTLNLDSIDSLFLDVTGTTTVTAVTLTSGHWRIVRATGAFQITASATLIVNGQTAVNFTTAANDLLLFEGYGSSTVRVWKIGNTGSPYYAGGTDVALADGGTGASLTDPNADRILFWDDSAGSMAWLVPNTNLTVSGTDLNVVTGTSGATIPLLNGANTWSAAQTFSGLVPATFQYVDDGAQGPIVVFLHNSASPAANDISTILRFQAKNTSNASTTFAEIRVRVDDATAGSEDGSMLFLSANAGTNATRMTLGQGLQIGTPTGTDKGAGTINVATAIYQNNVQVATLSGSETLTNKSLTSPTFTGTVTFPSGSWTPVPRINGSATGVTTSSAQGSYLLVGDLYVCTTNIVLTSNGAGTGAFDMTGLPGTVSSGTGMIPKGYSNFSGLTGAPFLCPDSAATTVSLKQTGAATAAALTDTNVTDTAAFNGMFFFRV